MAPAAVPDLVAERPMLAGLLRTELARHHREGLKPLRPERVRPDADRSFVRWATQSSAKIE